MFSVAVRTMDNLYQIEGRVFTQYFQGYFKVLAMARASSRPRQS
jgi:hypothetical protein